MIIGVLPVFENYCTRVIKAAVLTDFTCCAMFVTGIGVMTFFLVLVWSLHVWPLVCVIRKHQSDDHLGFAEAFEFSLAPWRATLQQPACLSVLLLILPFVSLVFAMGAPFIFCYSVIFFCIDRAPPPTNSTFPPLCISNSWFLFLSHQCSQSEYVNVNQWVGTLSLAVLR